MLDRVCGVSCREHVGDWYPMVGGVVRPSQVCNPVVVGWMYCPVFLGSGLCVLFVSDRGWAWWLCERCGDDIEGPFVFVFGSRSVFQA